MNVQTRKTNSFADNSLLYTGESEPLVRQKAKSVVHTMEALEAYSSAKGDIPTVNFGKGGVHSHNAQTPTKQLNLLEESRTADESSNFKVSEETLNYLFDDNTCVELGVALSALPKEVWPQVIESYFEEIQINLGLEKLTVKGNDLFFNLFVPEGIEGLDAQSVTKIRHRAIDFLQGALGEQLKGFEAKEFNPNELANTIAHGRQEILSLLRQSELEGGHKIGVIAKGGQLGVGGTSIAFECDLDENRAYKVMKPGMNLPEENFFNDPDKVEKFIKVTKGHDSLLNFEGIAEVDFGEGKRVVEIMEKIKGAPRELHKSSEVRALEQMVKSKNIDSSVQNDLIASLIDSKLLKFTDALGYMHKKGYIHRDIKPANVMFDNKGGVKLMDYGLVIESQFIPPETPNHIAGTLAYMSPEAFKLEKITTASDVYSMGLMIYDLCGGQRPTSNNLLGAMSIATLDDPIKKIDELKLHPRLRALIVSCVDKDPENRPTAEQVRLELEKLIPILRSHANSAIGNTNKKEVGVFRAYEGDEDAKEDANGTVNLKLNKSQPTAGTENLKLNDFYDQPTVVRKSVFMDESSKTEDEWFAKGEAMNNKEVSVHQIESVDHYNNDDLKALDDVAPSAHELEVQSEKQGKLSRMGAWMRKGVDKILNLKAKPIGIKGSAAIKREVRYLEHEALFNKQNLTFDESSLIEETFDWMALADIARLAVRGTKNNPMEVGVASALRYWELNANAGKHKLKKAEDLIRRRLSPHFQ